MCEVSWDLDNSEWRKDGNIFYYIVFVFVNLSGKMTTCKMSMEKCWISPLCWFQLSFLNRNWMSSASFGLDIHLVSNTIILLHNGVSRKPISIDELLIGQSVQHLTPVSKNWFSTERVLVYLFGKGYSLHICWRTLCQTDVASYPLQLQWIKTCWHVYAIPKLVQYQISLVLNPLLLNGFNDGW